MLPIDLLQRARRIVFVKLSQTEFLVIAALRASVEVSWWIVGIGQALRVHRTAQSAEALGLFDGYAWNIERLSQWVRKHCPVCWNVLGSARQTYDANKCRQKAYRQRRKHMPKGLYGKYTVTNNESGQIVEGVFVLKPATDLHARMALIAYAASIDFENPLLASDLRNWIDSLNAEYPADAFNKAYELPDWLIRQSRDRGDK